MTSTERLIVIRAVISGTAGIVNRRLDGRMDVGMADAGVRMSERKDPTGMTAQQPHAGAG